MNIIKPLSDQERRREMVRLMRLSGQNADLALEYLSTQTEQEELLNQLQLQQFSRDMNPWVVLTAFQPRFSGEDGDLRTRFVKLSWALGRSSSVLLWRGTGAKWMAYCDFVESILGREAVVSMELEAAVWGIDIGMEPEHLAQIARGDPKLLQRAVGHGQTVAPWMKVLVAGLLLAYAKGEAYRTGQWEIIRQAVLDKLAWDKVIETNSRRALEDYIRREDAAAPMPPFARPTDQMGMVVLQQGQPIQQPACPRDLLGAACFLALPRQPQALCANRMHLQYYFNEALLGIFRLCPMKFISDHLDVLKGELKGGEAGLLGYLVSRYRNLHDEALIPMMRQCLGSLDEAMDQGNADRRETLRDLFPKQCDALNRDDRMDIVRFLCTRVGGDKQALEEFLLDTGPIVDTEERLKNVQCAHLYAVNRELKQHILAQGWTDLSCRYVAAALLCLNGPWNLGYLTEQRADRAFLEGFTDAMLRRQLPLAQLVQMLGVFHENSYHSKEKALLEDFAAREFSDPEYREEWYRILQTGGVFARRAAVRMLEAQGDKGVLAACGDSAKQVKELLLELLPKHPEWAEDYGKLLGARKAAQRLMAVELLSRLGRRDLLEAALAGEKNAKVAQAIRAKVGAEAPVPDSCQDLVQQLLKGNKIRKLSWLTEKPLPVLHLEDGSEVSEDLRNALFLSYSELGRIGRCDTGRELARGIVDLPRLAVAVFEFWMEEKAPAKHKWVLAFSAVFGGSAMTARLVRAIHDWPNNARGAIACDAVFALALSDDPAALVNVDAISRKFKFRQVKAAAAQALDNAARELGITSEELADRIVPTLGFGTDGTRVFDYGKRSFTVRLTPTLELAITNDQGKAVKNLPAPGKTDEEMAAAAYEEFKAMKKQLKTTVSAQRARLEAALSGSRCWEADRWRALFVENPIMHQFAMSLIWGVYDGGVLRDTFRYMEDGSFNTVDEEEYRLPETGLIGLVHPVELDADTLEAWKQQLEDYEITQALEQLLRPVYHLDDSEGKLKKLEKFGGRVLNGLSLSGRLLALGWYRGSVLDGGVFYTYYREDGPLAVELRFSGSPVGDENDDVTVFDALFYRPGTVRRGSYVYDTVQEQHTLSLGEVPARYYSEIILQLTKATASSTETNPDWKTMQ